MKINNLEILDNISYDTYKNWLEQVSFRKQTLLKKDNDRLVLINEINKFRSEISKRFSKVTRLEKDIKEIREELINAIPNKI